MTLYAEAFVKVFCHYLFNFLLDGFVRFNVVQKFVFLPTTKNDFNQ